MQTPIPDFNAISTDQFWQWWMDSKMYNGKNYERITNSLTTEQLAGFNAQHDKFDYAARGGRTEYNSKYLRLKGYLRDKPSLEDALQQVGLIATDAQTAILERYYDYQITKGRSEKTETIREKNLSEEQSLWEDCKGVVADADLEKLEALRAIKEKNNNRVTYDINLGLKATEAALPEKTPQIKLRPDMGDVKTVSIRFHEALRKSELENFIENQFQEVAAKQVYDSISQRKSGFSESKALGKLDEMMKSNKGYDHNGVHEALRAFQDIAHKNGFILAQQGNSIG